MHFNLNYSRWISKIYKNVYLIYYFHVVSIYVTNAYAIDRYTLHNILMQNRCRLIGKAPLFFENSHYSSLLLSLIAEIHI